MQLKDFQTLIEIQALEKIIQKHLKNIESQKQRILKLNNEVEKKKKELIDKENLLMELKKNVSYEEKIVYDLESKIEKSNHNLKLAKTEQQATACENELKILRPKVERHEEQALEMLEKIELLVKEIEAAKTFIEGSKDSIKEVTIEVNQEVSKEEQKIRDNQERIDTLIGTCPIEAQNTFQYVNQKHQYNDPLTFVQNNMCIRCHYTINRQLQSQLERGTVLELCPCCNRILTPNAARVTKVSAEP